MQKQEKWEPRNLGVICPGEVFPNEQETDTRQLPAGQVVDLGCGEMSVDEQFSNVCSQMSAPAGVRLGGRWGSSNHAVPTPPGIPR